MYSTLRTPIVSNAVWTIQSLFYESVRRIPFLSFVFETETKALRAMVRALPRKPDRVLDLGVGCGDALAEAPSDATVRLGVDLNAGMLRRAAKRLRDASFVRADVRDLPIRGGSFDLVLCVGLAEYFRDEDELMRTVGELLAPDGHAVFTMSPVGGLTLSRRLLGHRVFSKREEDVEAGLRRRGFHVVTKTRTALQVQYLINKDGDEVGRLSA